MSDLLDRALESIRRRRDHARSVGFELIGVVGSVARGEDRPDSDVDIAYDVIEGVGASLLGLGGLWMDLHEDLGRQIGFIDISMAQPYWRPVLERDLVTA